MLKSLAILAFAAALEAGFLLTLAIPAPLMARAEAAVREKVVQLARATVHGPPTRLGRG